MIWSFYPGCLLLSLPGVGTMALVAKYLKENNKYLALAVSCNYQKTLFGRVRNSGFVSYAS